LQSLGAAGGCLPGWLAVWLSGSSADCQAGSLAGRVQDFDPRTLPWLEMLLSTWHLKFRLVDCCESVACCRREDEIHDASAKMKLRAQLVEALATRHPNTPRLQNLSRPSEAPVNAVALNLACPGLRKYVHSLTSPPVWACVAAEDPLNAPRPVLDMQKSEREGSSSSYFALRGVQLHNSKTTPRFNTPFGLTLSARALSTPTERTGCDYSPPRSFCVFSVS
jgi:hypothetical protein